MRQQKEQDIQKEKEQDGRWGRNGRLRAALVDIALLLLLSLRKPQPANCCG